MIKPSSSVDFEHSIVANEYGFYCVPAAYADREVPKILANGGVYEPATLALMARILRRGGDVITGGTFIGDFLPALSEALTPDAKLHTFEPNPVASAAAAHTMWLNGLENIDLHDCAIGEEAGEVHLKVATLAGKSMAARAKIVDSPKDGETVTVAVRKIDDLVDIKRRIAILHLDVEGFEWPAVLGAQKTIAAHLPCIIIEAEKPWKRRKIEADLGEIFPQAGYRSSGYIERNVIYLPRTEHGPFGNG